MRLMQLLLSCRTAHTRLHTPRQVGDLEPIYAGAALRLPDKPSSPLPPHITIRNDPTLTVSASPHIRTTRTVASCMWNVIAALLPALIFAIYYFGIGAVIVTGSGYRRMRGHRIYHNPLHAAAGPRQ